mmetsp:Transcript_91534/g.144649  ORF Transcript_91534/g.144649 Transcript_91534/m.144649 type:complete len:204 (-) Transcript_91534:607-1218(-)
MSFRQQINSFTLPCNSASSVWKQTLAAPLGKAVATVFVEWLVPSVPCSGRLTKVLPCSVFKLRRISACASSLFTAHSRLAPISSCKPSHRVRTRSLKSSMSLSSISALDLDARSTAFLASASSAKSSLKPLKPSRRLASEATCFSESFAKSLSVLLILISIGGICEAIANLSKLSAKRSYLLRCSVARFSMSEIRAKKGFTFS